MNDNELVAQIDYDKLHKLISIMYAGVTITSSGRKVPKAERVTVK